MSRIGFRIGTVGAAAGGFAAALLALSPTASADPAAPVVPPSPGNNIVQQLTNAPALASQFLQSAVSMLSGASTPAPPASPVAPAATPAAPSPTASATLNLPQAETPAASAPLNSAVGTVPGSELITPAASSPLPLLNQLGLPGNIASITQNLPGLGTNSAAIPAIPAPAPAAPVEPTDGQNTLPPTLNPFSALP